MNVCMICLLRRSPGQSDQLLVGSKNFVTALERCNANAESKSAHALTMLGAVYEYGVCVGSGCR